MGTSRSSRAKERDDEYRSNRSHAYGKKRRRSPSCDLEDRGNRSSHKNKDYPAGRRDALADFRAGVSEDEAHHQNPRHYDDPAFSNDSHRRERDKGAHNEHVLSHRDHSRSRSYKENQRNSARYPSEDMSFARERDYSKDISWGHGFGPDRETYESHHRRQVTPDEVEQLESHNRSNKTTEDRSSRFDQRLRGHGQADRRGRSISRASPAQSSSRSSSSQATSALSVDSHRHSHKRRRQRSRSKSPLRGRKEGRNRKHKRSRSRRKDRERGERERSESKRSVLTGKKIKLKVKKDRGDDERDAKRQELLKFLNSAYE